MPLSTLIILTYIVSMFAVFILAVGGSYLWVVLGDLKDRRAARRVAAQIRPTALKTA